MNFATLRRLTVLTLVLPLTICLCKGGGKGGKSKTPKVPKAPEPPAPEPVPDTTEQEAESRTVRDDERKKAARRRGASGTVLTNPLGDASAASAGPSLLGRMGGS